MCTNHSPSPIQLVLAFVGSNGAGKDTVVDYILATHKLARISISDMVRLKASELSVPHTRENLNRISKDLIERYGADYFARLALATIERSKATHVVVPDIRSPQDVKTFRNELGEKFVLIAIAVKNAHVRFKRLVARGTPRDPKSWDEFVSSEHREEKIFQIHSTISLSDYTIRNDQGLSKLRDDVDLIVSKLGLPKKQPSKSSS